MQLRSFRCLCSSVHFSSMPSLCYSGLRQSIADQLSITLLCCAIADQIYTPLTYAFAKQIIALPLPCITLQYVAFAVRFRALHIFAIALHIDAVRCHCFAALPKSPHCHRQAILNFASPQLCFLSPRHASASQFHLYFAIPLRVYAFCTLPLPFFAPPNTELPWPFFAPPTPARCHCHATLNPSGAHFGVAHRSGPRNMALTYRFYHDQVWQLPHDGADDVDLVRIRIRVPDSLTDLDAVSPSFDRRHRPADVFIR